MRYHSTPAVVSQMCKISFHGSSSSPISALGLAFDQGFTWTLAPRPGFFFATLEANVVEQLAQGFCVAPVVAGELDGFVAHLRHGGDSAVQVLGAFVAHGKELKAERNLVSTVFSGGEQIRRLRSREGSRGGDARFEKITSGDRLGFHGDQSYYQIETRSGRLNFGTSGRARGLKGPRPWGPLGDAPRRRRSYWQSAG